MDLPAVIYQINLKKKGFWVRGVDLKHNEHKGLLVDDFVIGDLRDLVCKNILDISFDEVYQLAADMGVQVISSPVNTMRM